MCWSEFMTICSVSMRLVAYPMQPSHLHSIFDMFPTSSSAKCSLRTAIFLGHLDVALSFSVSYDDVELLGLKRLFGCLDRVLIEILLFHIGGPSLSGVLSLVTSEEIIFFSSSMRLLAKVAEHSRSVIFFSRDESLLS